MTYEQIKEEIMDKLQIKECCYSISRSGVHSFNCPTREEKIKVRFNKPQEECKCACHENKLNKLYEHDTKCCESMNGFIPTSLTEIK